MTGLGAGFSTTSDGTSSSSGAEMGEMVLDIEVVFSQCRNNRLKRLEESLNQVGR